MKRFVDLTDFTLMLIIATACVIPPIKAKTRKKTWLIRLAIICTAILVFSVVITINLRPIYANGSQVVYITDTGSKYHSTDCYSLYNSKTAISLSDAVSHGYDDCSRCNVPEYIAEPIYPTIRDLYDSKNIKYTFIGILAMAFYFSLYFIPCLIHKWVRRR